jgi:threonine aldolase
MKNIDLRSDTVTRPTQQMRTIMADAEVGDDVYGEDPTVNRLEQLAAKTIGTEAALFVSSGTQSNLLALFSHCRRGDEYIVGQEAHTYKFEGGGAVLASIQPQPIHFETDGRLDLDKVAEKVKPIDDHFARTRLLCLENTHNGKVLETCYLKAARAFVDQRGLSLHLDGARVFNAAVKLNLPVTDITCHFDSVSFCLSKGLGAPVGSVLCGSGTFIQEARRWRKVVGGGMRQAGIIAAAGIYALENNIDRLANDHENAQILADGLAPFSELALEPDTVQTNMVFFSMDPRKSDALKAHCQSEGVRISGQGQFSLVTHLDITAEDVHRVIHVFREFFDRP